MYVSPSATGILKELHSVKGQHIERGTPLFSVDPEIWLETLKQAQNELGKALADHANLTKGKRAQELAVIEEQKKQAQAVLINAQKEFARAAKLVKSNTVSQSHYDAKLAEYETAKAKAAQMEAELKAARLPAREDEIQAAEHAVEIARQNLAKLQMQAEQNAPNSPVDGTIADVYFRIGEFVPAGSPVVSVLPPENVKARFFVSEKLLPALSYNQPVFISCDGCARELPARISFISPNAEFTPPVIFSTESRQKLVFMIEAAFDNPDKALTPGLPVSVRIEKNDGIGD